MIIGLFYITDGFNVGDLQLFMQLVLVIHINVCMYALYDMVLCGMCTTKMRCNGQDIKGLRLKPL
jgi:hypothetical protein